MKEISPTWKMAFAVNMLHASRCSFLTSMAMGIIYIIGLFVLKLLGKPIDYYYFQEYSWHFIGIGFMIYSWPVNLYVTRGLMQQRFKKFRITVVVED